MAETELKFQLPVAKKRAVLQRLKRAQAASIRLQAKYYDTPERVLAKHGIAIRLRQEGEQWVQTFKANSHHHLQRIEEEIHLGICEQEPVLDLSLYQNNKTVSALLDNVLDSTSNPLELQFQTRVQRYFYVQTINDSRIEICLDDGEISTPDGKIAICEMEFELKDGSIEALIEATRTWISQYNLWLDVRSKAERGHLLATKSTVASAARATPLALDPKLNPEQVLQAIVANGLAQLLPNSAAIAAGVATVEHIHQARIAIRRLRSALKNFGRWSSHVEPHWLLTLTELFRELGTTRDVDVITSEILPELVRLGAPDLTPTLPDQQANNPQLFTQASHVNLLLDLLSFAHRTYSTPHNKSIKNKVKQQAANNHQVKHQIAKRLQHLHQQIIDDANCFEQLDIDARHKTRKRVKQLRYLIEFVSSLYAKKQVKQYLKQLQPVQDQLGAYNDLFVAEAFFKQQITHNPHFWFALGWSNAQQQHALTQSTKALQQFRSAKSFW